jgi:hypothetical protein
LSCQLDKSSYELGKGEREKFRLFAFSLFLCVKELCSELSDKYDFTP